MTRYTRKDLDEQITVLNNQLRKYMDNPYYFQVQGRNGYTAIDKYLNPDHPLPPKHGPCINTVICGTPRECIAGAHREAFEMTVNQKLDVDYFYKRAEQLAKLYN